MTTRLSALNRLHRVLQRRALALALLCSCAATPVMALRPPGLTWGELSLLPAYCQDTQSTRPGMETGGWGPNAKYWFGVMGPSFKALHHYCWALATLRRSTAAGISAQQRLGLIDSAISDLNYVLTNIEPTFVLMPDFFVTYGDAQMARKRYDVAIGAYGDARRAKPSYWRPYSHWANALFELGDRKGAIAVLEEGMRAAPTEEALQAQYKRLGGDPAKFMRSLPKAPAAPASAAAPVAAASEPAPPPPAASAASAASN